MVLILIIRLRVFPLSFIKNSWGFAASMFELFARQDLANGQSCKTEAEYYSGYYYDCNDLHKVMLTD